MSAALRINNNKRKPARLSKSLELDVQDSRNSSPKSAEDLREAQIAKCTTQKNEQRNQSSL
jgi:hypothetical protein